jgi:ABC-2 type transport system permease protein
VTATLIASAVLPLVVLLLGVAAFGNEVGDRTLVYLTTKPLPRWRIVAPKLLAVVLVGGVPVAVSGAAAIAIVEDGALGGAIATGAGLLAGAAAYSAIFTWAGLATRHALVAGLVYVFVWEAALAAYLDGIRFLSVRRFALAIVRGLDDGRLSGVDLALSGRAAAAGVVLVVCGFTALAVRKLTRMDVP